MLSRRHSHLDKIEKSAGSKYQVPMAKVLQSRWKDNKPSNNDRAYYDEPSKYPLTPSSTIKDAIICLTASHPGYLEKGKEKGVDKPLDTHYPYILEEATRLVSEEAKQFLHECSTQELRQALSQVIESFGSGSKIAWKWHDQYQSDGIESREGRKGEALKKERVDGLFVDIMELSKVKDLIAADPSMGPQIQGIFGAAVKVICFCSSTSTG